MDAILAFCSSKLFKYVTLFSVYTIVGSFIFIALENKDGTQEIVQQKNILQEKLKTKMKIMFNSSGDVVDALAKDFLEAYSDSKDVKWDFNHGFVFVVQLVSTIGYGNIAPVTQWGRFFSIIYAFFGIILTVITLQALGQHMFHIERKLVIKVEKAVYGNNVTTQKLPEKCLLSNAFMVVLLILLGATFEVYSKNGSKKGWSFLDGVYAWFITFTTIGFGDMIPDSLPQWVNCFYTLIGLANMSCLLNAMTACTELSVKTVLITCVTCCYRRRQETISPDSGESSTCAALRTGGKVEISTAIMKGKSRGTVEETARQVP